MAELSETCETHFVSVSTVMKLRKRFVPDEQLQLLAETFKTLGDPTRAKIIFVLSQQELCVCDLANLLGVSQSAVSHSLRALRQMRLVKFRKEGKIAYYTLDDEHIAHLLDEGFRHVEDFV